MCFKDLSRLLDQNNLWPNALWMRINVKCNENMKDIWTDGEQGDKLGSALGFNNVRLFDHLQYHQVTHQ